MSTAHNATESLKVLLAQTVGERLEKTLRVTGISAQEMAAHLEVSRTSISNWIHGRAPINRGNLIAWALRTGIPLEWIETGRFPGESKNPHQSPDGGHNVGLAGYDPTTSTVKYGRSATIHSLTAHRTRKAS